MSPPGPPYLAREEIEQLRRSIAMLQPGSLAMTREDAVRLFGELGEAKGRLDRLCNGLRALLERGLTLWPEPVHAHPGSLVVQGERRGGPK